MNIFVLHWKPRKAARWHVDKHVVKMLLETCQLLYTAHWVLFYPHLKEQKSAVGLSRAQKQLAVPDYMQSAPLCQTTQEPTYRPCHVHHPCAKWSRATSGNYGWLVELGKELAREFRFRFHKVHSCEAHIDWLAANRPPNIQHYPKRPFVMAMGDEFKISKNAIVSYRNYYRKGKADLIRYTGRQVPHWISGVRSPSAHWGLPKGENKHPLNPSVKPLHPSVKPLHPSVKPSNPSAPSALKRPKRVLIS